MLRPVEEIQAQTRVAIEDHVMSQIDKVSREKGTSVCIENSVCPDWLILKLKSYGYTVIKGLEESDIYWGVGNDK